MPLEPVMGAFAHLVTFDEALSGFAHLHPMETDLTQCESVTIEVNGQAISVKGRFLTSEDKKARLNLLAVTNSPAKN